MHLLKLSVTLKRKMKLSCKNKNHVKVQHYLLNNVGWNYFKTIGPNFNFILQNW
jgi:hypothetical protein